MANSENMKYWDECMDRANDIHTSDNEAIMNLLSSIASSLAAIADMMAEDRK